MHWFEKAYVSLPVPKEHYPQLQALQNEIVSVLTWIDSLRQVINIKTSSDLHLTLDYLWDKSQEKSQQFSNHIYTIWPQHHGKNVYFNKLDYWQSFVKEDGHVISLGSDDPMLQDIYKSLEIPEWKGTNYDERIFKPHITLLKFYLSESMMGMDEMFHYRIKPLFDNKSYCLHVKDYILKNKRSQEIIE